MQVNRIAILPAPRLILLCSLCLLQSVSPVFPEWPDTGRRVTPIGGSFEYVYEIVPDGMGGAYVGWYATGPDWMGSRVQHIDAEGNVLWDPQGVSAVDPDSANRTIFQDLLEDGNGNVYVLSTVGLGEDPSLFTVQKLAPDGERLWGALGKSVTGDATPALLSGMWNPMIPDGNGNIIVVFRVPYNGDNYRFVTKLDSNGDPIWTTQMGSILHGGGRCVPDGSGGIICVLSGVNADDDHAFLGARVTTDGQMAWPDTFYVLNTWPEYRRMPYGIYQLVPSYNDGALLIAQTGNDAHIPSEELILVHIGLDGTLPLGDRGATLLGMDDYIDHSKMQAVVWNDHLYIVYYVPGWPPEFGYYVLKTDETGTLFYPDTVVNFDSTSLRGGYIALEQTEEHLLVGYGRRKDLGNTTRYPYCQGIEENGTSPWGLTGHLITDTTSSNDADRLKMCNVGGDTVFAAWMPSDDGAVYVMPVYPDGSSPWYDNPVPASSPPESPQGFRIESVYPQPFNDRVTLVCILPHPSDVILSLYNVNGQRIYHASHRFYRAGRQKLSLSLNNTAAGVFFAEALMGDQRRISKLIHIP